MLQPQQIDKPFRVIGHDHYGHSFLIFASKDALEAHARYDQERAKEDQQYPGIDLVHMLQHAEKVQLCGAGAGLPDSG